MAGGLSIEVEDDVLVENAAAATLLSPGVWVHRRSPGSTPATAGRPRRSAELAAAHGPPAALDIEGAAAGATPSVAALAAMTLSPRSGGAAGDAAAAGHAAVAAAAPPASPTMGLAADPELAYLQLGGEDRERRRREYLEQDAEHMRALEEAHARLSEQNAAMHEQLQAVLAAVNEVAGENTTIKSLLAMLQVKREDFVFNPHQTIAAQQEAIGMRLLQNLDSSPPRADEQQQQQQQQQQQPAAMSLQAQLRQGQAAAQPPPPSQLAAQPQQQGQQQTAAQQQQQQQQGGAVDEGAPFGSQQPDGAPTPAFDMLASPAPGLLPLSTPSMLRTVSPKIAAFRGSADLLGGTGGGLGGGMPAVPPPTVAPASPYDFPAESQIAAAALTAKQGDAAAALLTLLDKAIEGRTERLAAHAQQAQQTQQVFQM